MFSITWVAGTAGFKAGAAEAGISAVSAARNRKAETGRRHIITTLTSWFGPSTGGSHSSPDSETHLVSAPGCLSNHAGDGGNKSDASTLSFSRPTWRAACAQRASPVSGNEVRPR